MNKQQRATLVMETLEKYFPEVLIPLSHQDPYTLLIAVLLSAQCTDKRVNETTPKLFSKAATPDAMLLLTPDVIEEIIRPCGLSKTKSKAIYRLSEEIIHKFGGKVPMTFEDLESLPGVGHKTASVVMAQAFHIPAFPVDTHIHRCAKRWNLSSGKNVETTEKDLKKLFPKKLWDKLHLQIIYFARSFCPARGNNQSTCPICSVLGTDQKEL